MTSEIIFTALLSLLGAGGVGGYLMNRIKTLEAKLDEAYQKIEALTLQVGKLSGAEELGERIIDKLDTIITAKKTK